MMKSIFAVVLMLSVCAGIAFSQTKKRIVRRGKKITTVKKITAPIKTMTTPVNPSAITTASGLTYIVTKKGTGAQLKAGDTIIVNYTGMFTNGEKFDSSFDRGEPISFPLGAGRVIKGWDEGFQHFRIGDHAMLIIPASIAYGAGGKGSIPPDTTLIFVVEVVGVQ